MSTEFLGKTCNNCGSTFTIHPLFVYNAICCVTKTTELGSLLGGLAPLESYFNVDENGCWSCEDKGATIC